MIRSRRALSAPSLGALHEIVAWVDLNARVHVFRSRELACDDRLFQLAFGRLDAGDRSLVTLVLEGRLHLESDGARFCCEPGQGVYLPRKGTLAARTEGRAYESLVLEWDADARHSARALAFEPASVVPLATRVLESERPDRDVLERVTGLLGSLAPLEGLDFGRPSMVGPDELRFQEVATALDDVLSSLDEQPMAIDLQTKLGVSARQVTRIVDAFRERYGYGSTNWQDARSRRRLMLAAALLTAPTATVTEVAQIVGYSRPETLTRAFATAGLPRPSAIRDEVARLGEAWRASVADGGRR